jgi:hypothetical protein
VVIVPVKMINRKKRTNSKPKIAAYQKEARKGLKGLILRWVDADPFSENAEITNTDVSHKNPTQRLIVDEMWRQCSKWICETEFTWNVVMKVFHDTGERGLKVDEYEFDFTCTLRGKKSDILNDAMEASLNESRAGNDAFPDGHKNKGVYLRCDFIATVTGI